jgi:hypothetical protein
METVIQIHTHSQTHINTHKAMLVHTHIDTYLHTDTDRDTNTHTYGVSKNLLLSTQNRQKVLHARNPLLFALMSRQAGREQEERQELQKALPPFTRRLQ